MAKSEYGKGYDKGHSGEIPTVAELVHQAIVPGDHLSKNDRESYDQGKKDGASDRKHGK